MMRSTNNPWCSRFDGLLDRKVIKSRAEVEPSRLHGLETMTAPLAVAVLEQSLNGFIKLSEPELDILEFLVSRFHAHCVLVYPSKRAYIENLHGEDLVHAYPPPVCITGLAGTGKSTLMAALDRALPGDSNCAIEDPVLGRELNLRSCVRTRVDVSSTFSTLLSPWLPKAEGKVGGRHLDQSLRRAARYAYRVGMCANLLDELQFVAQSATASTKVTRLLMFMSHLRVPLVYNANFSLCHKLLDRLNEETDRVLVETRVVPRLTLDDKGLGSLLQSYDVVLGECVDSSLGIFLPEYSAMTLGIRRKVRELTIQAIAVMKAKRERRLSKDHLRLAFEKKVSEAFRNDVRCLAQQAQSCESLPGRKDLWCPFGMEFNKLDFTQTRGSSVAENAEKKVTRILTHQALTAKERNAVKELERGIAEQPSQSTGRGATVLSMKSRSSTLSAENLLRNTIANKKK